MERKYSISLMDLKLSTELSHLKPWELVLYKNILKFTTGLMMAENWIGTESRVDTPNTGQGGRPRWESI